MIPMHRKARPCPLPSRKPHLLQAVFRGTSSSGRAGAAAQTGAGAFFGRSLKKHGQTDGFPSAFLRLPVWDQRAGLCAPPLCSSHAAASGPRSPSRPAPGMEPVPRKAPALRSQQGVRAQARRYFAAQAWTISSISAMCRRMSLASAIWQRARTRLCSG